RAGMRVVPPEQAGLQQFVLDLLSQGTEKYTNEQFAQLLEDRAISFGVSLAPDYSQVTITAVRDDFDVALEALNQVLFAATFPEEEVEQERTQLVNAARASALRVFDPVYDAARKAIYGPGGYGAPSAGLPEAYQALLRDDLMNFYHRFYIPNNITLVLVGDFNADEAVEKIKAATASQAAGELPPEIGALGALTTPQLAETQTIQQERQMGTVFQVLAWPAPPVSRVQEYVALKLVNYVVGGAPLSASRLFFEIRERRGLAYATASIYPTRQDISAFVAYAQTDPGPDAQQTYDLILQVVQDMGQTPLTERQLREAKDGVIGAFALDQETNAERAFFLGLFELSGAGYELVDQYIDLVEGLTSEEVQAVAQQVFSQPYVRVALGPPGALQ
ncbi:MAG: insulinase family protein, partial [Deinococcus sp.]|nr:insulinase family protein [Deinococcus sp.]